MKVDDEKINQLRHTITVLNNENETMKSSVFNWKIPRQQLCSVMLAGNTVFAGGEGFVISVDSESGEETWHEKVDGKAVGLAVHDGSLYVSTESGNIYCFREGSDGGGNEIVPAVASSPYPEK